MNEGAIALFDLIDQIVEMPDDLDEQAIALFQELINSSFNIEAKERFIRSQVDSLYQRDVPKTKALEDAEKLNHIMDEVIADYGNLTDTKKQFITTILSQIKELTMEYKANKVITYYLCKETKEIDIKYDLNDPIFDIWKERIIIHFIKREMIFICDAIKLWEIFDN